MAKNLWLLYQIKLAQITAGVPIGTERKRTDPLGGFGGRGSTAVENALRPEGLERWRAANLPGHLLASDLALIVTYAEKCGTDMTTPGRDRPLNPEQSGECGAVVFEEWPSDQVDLELATEIRELFGDCSVMYETQTPAEIQKDFNQMRVEREAEGLSTSLHYWLDIQLRVEDGAGSGSALREMIRARLNAFLEFRGLRHLSENEK
jgi:hypothetical protein